MAKLTSNLSPWLTEDVIVQLRHIGVKTVVDFVCEDPEQLTLKAGISYKVLSYLIFLLMYSFV